MMASGVNVDFQNLRRATALMMACLGGHTDTVNLLLDMEADLTLKNIFGRTALNLAQLVD